MTTPSKEPSVDEILEDYARGLSAMPMPQINPKTPAKSQLLALHLGCLKEKPEEYDLWGADLQIGFDRAQDLMEQKLREMYK